jgi:hypothetical protein
MRDAQTFIVIPLTLESLQPLLCMPEVQTVRVELLYFEGCPKFRDARELLDKVLRSRGIDSAVVQSFRVDATTTHELRFEGSPTIRVDGMDIEPGFEESGDYGLRCRLYPMASGLGHVPDVAWIEIAVDKALQHERDEETTA